MKNVFKTLCVILFLFQTNLLIGADIRVFRGDEGVFAGGNYEMIIINGSAKILGDASAEILTVNSDAFLIVYGDLNISNDGNTPLTVAGTLLVTGDLTIDGTSIDNNRVFSNGVLAVGGSYDFGSGSETNTGEVFLSDINDAGGLSGGNGGVGDIDDLINSGILPDDVLNDFLDHINGYNFPNYNWVGNTNTFWDEVSNWSGSEVPGRANNVTIISTAGNFPLGCSGTKEYLMYNLTLEPGAEFTIPAGSKVTVYGDITIPPSSKLIIENSATNPTSFINHGSILDGLGGTGEVVMKWDYDLDRYWYIGHSITSPDISSYEVNSYKLFKYESGWKDITGTNDFGGTLTGYALKITGASGNTISHTGELNNADFEQELVSGFQLITNPYPSYYQLSDESVEDGDFRFTTGSVYVRTGTDTRFFETFNTLTNISSPVSFDGVIAPGQCFWVKRNEAAVGDQKVYMSLDKRIHGTSSLKSTASNKKEDNFKNLIRVNLANDNRIDEAVIAFREFGVLENSRYDSRQRYMTKNNLSYIYSIKEDVDNVISVFPNEFGYLSIPLGIKAKEGIHSISAMGLNQIDPSISIILEDMYEGISINLRESNGYSFDSSAGNITDRFLITFIQVSTDVNAEKLKEQNSDEVSIYSVSNRIMVKQSQSNTEEKEINVYNLDGEKILESKFVGDEFSSAPISAKGIYLVKVIEKSKETVKKIYIH